MIAVLFATLNFLAMASLGPDSPWAPLGNVTLHGSPSVEESESAELSTESPPRRPAGSVELLATVAAELAALAIFVYLVGLASRVLVPGHGGPLVLAVVGNSAAILVIARLSGDAAHGWSTSAVGMLPVAICCGALGGYLSRTSSNDRLDASRTGGAFCLLGQAVFSLALPIGLLIAKSTAWEGNAGRRSGTLHWRRWPPDRSSPLA